MEAPKKIYIDDFGSELSFDWHAEHSYARDIEYVRKDAFIKKACDWIKEFIQRENDYLVSDAYIFSQIKEFRKAMEG